MTGLNFSKNTQIALIFIIGISLIGLAYGRIRNTKQAAVSQAGVSIVEQTPNGRTEMDAPVITPQRTSGPTREVVVHVAGCVKNSGVYRLSPDSRIIEAIHAAGGPTADANLDAINLAAKVQDGTQIMVPSKNMSAQMPPVPVASQQSSGSRVVPMAPPPQSTGYSSGLVNINTAGINELDQLPGIGPATAKNIIEYRNQIGRFNAIDELQNVKGIGPKILEQIRPFVRL